MSANEENSSRVSLQNSGYFIDDYSHLRLSYYQQFNNLSSTDSTTDTFVSSDFTLETSLDCSTELSNLSEGQSGILKTGHHGESGEMLISQSSDRSSAASDITLSAGSTTLDQALHDIEPVGDIVTVWEPVNKNQEVDMYLPPPSLTIASMLGSASLAMGPVQGVYFQYNNTIEASQGFNKAAPQLPFSPQGRSTINPKYFKRN